MAKVINLKVGNKFYRARPPKASMSNPSINRAIQKLAAGESSNKRLSDSKKCLVVFMRRTKRLKGGKKVFTGKVTATQRCEGRKLPRKRNPYQCRGKNDRFVRCARGKKRSRKQRQYL